MKKYVGISLVAFTVACGSSGSENQGYTPSVEALTLTTPLYNADSDGCAIDPMASEVLDEWLAPVRERMGAPASLLDELSSSAASALSDDRVRWSVGNELQSLTLTQIRIGNGYEVELDYSEETSVGAFSWATGTMSLDQQSGSWRVFGWNGQPLMDVDWEQVGDELMVDHTLIGSGRTALRVQGLDGETVTLRENTETAAVASWDFELARGFVEVEGTRLCLEQSAASVCERVCDRGQ
ncbi:MAG: hypothetical protein AAFQ82_17705 [Myxococcota bacterium]